MSIVRRLNRPSGWTGLVTSILLVLLPWLWWRGMHTGTDHADDALRALDDFATAPVNRGAAMRVLRKRALSASPRRPVLSSARPCISAPSDEAPDFFTAMLARFGAYTGRSPRRKAEHQVRPSKNSFILAKKPALSGWVVCEDSAANSLKSSR